MELEPGATAPLPPAPIPARIGSDLVWTGTEFIVWGGLADNTSGNPLSQDGAAFDPAAGTWRQIAPPPDRVGVGVVLWTGTEMLVWSDGTPDTVSAAYDPATDTWRLIANPPVPGAEALWIGDAAVLLRDPDVDDDGFVDSLSSPSFAYDPATDEWRRLADGPWGRGGGVGGARRGVDRHDDHHHDRYGLGRRLLADGYDPATDTWRVLEGLDDA